MNKDGKLAIVGRTGGTLPGETKAGGGDTFTIIIDEVGEIAHYRRIRRIRV